MTSDPFGPADLTMPSSVKDFAVQFSCAFLPAARRCQTHDVDVRP